MVEAEGLPTISVGLELKAGVGEQPAVPGRPWDLKAAEIEAKRKELEAREIQLNPIISIKPTISLGSLATASVNHGPAKQANWPSFFPIIRHYISEDVPGALQPLAEQSFTLWKMTLAAFGVNLIVSLILLVVGTEGIATFLSASISLLLWPTLAFFSWHHALYRALQPGAGWWWWLLHLASLGLQIALFGLMTAGMMGMGGVLGLLEAIVRVQVVRAVMLGAGTAFMGFNTMAAVYLLQRTLRQFLGPPPTSNPNQGSAAV